MPRPELLPERLAVWTARLSSPGYKIAAAAASSEILAERYFAGVWLWEELTAAGCNDMEARKICFELGGIVERTPVAERDPWATASSLLSRWKDSQKKSEPTKHERQRPVVVGTPTSDQPAGDAQAPVQIPSEAKPPAEPNTTAAADVIKKIRSRKTKVEQPAGEQATA